ncbi:MAG TPA: hypothetical protein PKC28_08270 [Bdellovibrionales bacterium]|nr:hypothetical protein [Bdellovibrionales bacterium]
MLTPTTLVGLACLIANGSPADQEKLKTLLSQEEIVRVSEVIQSGACLPETFEEMLKKYKCVQPAMGSMMPTLESF